MGPGVPVVCQVCGRTRTCRGCGLVSEHAGRAVRLLAGGWACEAGEGLAERAEVYYFGLTPSTLSGTTGCDPPFCPAATSLTSLRVKPLKAIAGTRRSVAALDMREVHSNCEWERE